MKGESTMIKIEILPPLLQVLGEEINNCTKRIQNNCDHNFEEKKGYVPPSSQDLMIEGSHAPWSVTKHLCCTICNFGKPFRDI